MRTADRTVLMLDYFLVKHEEVKPTYDRPEAADDPRARRYMSLFTEVDAPLNEPEQLGLILK
jgi:hypothetical protein